MNRLVGALMTLLLAACASVEGPAEQVQQIQQPPASTAHVPPTHQTEQWVQFGMVLTVVPLDITLDDGRREAGLEMSILLDSGESLQVAQPLSQAGRLHEGDRVRVLRIGDFTRVTFWPYGNFSPRP